MTLVDKINGLVYRRPSYAEFRLRIAARNMRAQEVCSEMMRYVEYRPDPKGRDRWQSAQETWDRKGGDCEDLAVLAHDVLAAAGIDSSYCMLFSPRAVLGHVFLYSQNTPDWIVSNGVWLPSTPGTHADRVAEMLGWRGPVHAMPLLMQTVEALLKKHEGA